jgi:hypothetical protein
MRIDTFDESIGSAAFRLILISRRGGFASSFFIAATKWASSKKNSHFAIVQSADRAASHLLEDQLQR